MLWNFILWKIEKIVAKCLFSFLRNDNISATTESFLRSTAESCMVEVKSWWSLKKICQMNVVRIFYLVLQGHMLLRFPNCYLSLRLFLVICIRNVRLINVLIYQLYNPIESRSANILHWLEVWTEWYTNLVLYLPSLLILVHQLVVMYVGWSMLVFHQRKEWCTI